MRLIKTPRMPGDRGSCSHARAHREVIRRFGRFPTRNAALGRISQPGEQSYVDGGGIRGAVPVRELQAEAAVLTVTPAAGRGGAGRREVARPPSLDPDPLRLHRDDGEGRLVGGVSTMPSRVTQGRSPAM